MRGQARQHRVAAPARGGSARGAPSISSSWCRSGSSAARRPPGHHLVRAPRRSPGSAPPTRARRACATARRGATPARAPRWPPRAAAPRRRARPAARSRRTGCRRWPRTPRRRPSPASAATAPGDSGSSSSRTSASPGTAAERGVERVAGRRLPARCVATTSAGSVPIRRPSTMIESSVASSAQCTSSSTSTTGPGPRSSSAISRSWMSCGAASAASASSSSAETLPARSRNGPSGRGIERSSQVPNRTRPPARSPVKRRTSDGLADPRLAADRDHPALAARGGGVMPRPGPPVRRRARGGPRS